MARQTFGIDFGTTNSLIAVGVGDRAIALVDANNRPHPSVLWYRGSEVLVGAEARSHLDFTEGGAPPGFVRSPKMALRREGPIYVDGQEIDPTDAVAEVLKHLRRDAARGGRAQSYNVSHAVMTVPVDFGGPQRRALRAAARKAGIGVIQFVHEPAAALYAWIRSQKDWRKALAHLEGRVVLVFDWGGGTLDLTLCRVLGGTIVQMRSEGDDEVGGDRFDERLRNLARERHARSHHLEDVLALEGAGMAARLLTQCELRKIELSGEGVTSATLFIKDYLRTDGPARNLNLKLTREDLERESGDLIRRGISRIDSIIEQFHLTYQDIELCLATGGIVNMPVIRNALVERFGGRVPKLENGDRIIAEGAALIAHDELRLQLAKPIEVLVADGSGRGAYQEVVGVGFELPVENQTNPAANSRLYCVDPRDGIATFEFAVPKRLGETDPRGERVPLAIVLLPVDPAARPLVERLNCKIQIDHDYIAHVELESTGRKALVTQELHQLEFGLALPHAGSTDDSRSRAGGPWQQNSGGSGKQANATEAGRRGSISIRANIVAAANDREAERNWSLVPGDIVEGWKSEYFAHSGRGASAMQNAERDYYRRCAYCKRTSYSISADGAVEDCFRYRCGIGRGSQQTTPLARFGGSGPVRFND